MNRRMGPFLRCLDDLRNKPLTVSFCENPLRLPKSAAAKRLQLWELNMYKIDRNKRLEERLRNMKLKDKVVELWNELHEREEERITAQNKLADLEDICQDVIAGDHTALQELQKIMETEMNGDEPSHIIEGPDGRFLLNYITPNVAWTENKHDAWHCHAEGALTQRICQRVGGKFIEHRRRTRTRNKFF